MSDVPAAIDLRTAWRVHAASMPPLIRRAWPLPALLTWALAWTVYRSLQAAGASALLAGLTATAAGAALAALADSRTRRRVCLLGFPASLALLAIAGGAPAWPWLLALALLALAYPLGSWRDAPLFPTPALALRALPDQVRLAAGARVLDAGCGLGHGLAALRRAYPEARLVGVEWSWPLALAAALRCRWARVRRGDMWATDWSGFDLVYLYQRPESLPRALAKAQHEMRPGRWVASLEFAARDVQADAVVACPDGRALWLYRVAPLAPAAQACRRDADKNAVGPPSGPGGIRR